MQAEARNPRWRTNKPEIRISQHLHNVATWFQRLYPCFQGQRIQKSYFYIVWCKRKSEIQDGGPRNRKYSYLSLYTTYLQDSNVYIYVFKVQKFEKAILYIVWYKQNPEFQDGGSQTGNAYISACIQHSCKIPTVIPTFSKAKNWLKLFSTVCDCKVSQKSKMAAHKHGYLRFRSRHFGNLSLAWLHMIKNSYIEFLNLENMNTTFGIVKLYWIQAEIKVFPVCEPPS